MILQDIRSFAHIRSASGMAKLGPTIFVVGDDSPYLYKLDPQLDAQTDFLIYPVDSLVDLNIPKGIKPDFEAMEALNDHELLVFGSGSLSPQRDIMIHIRLKEPEPMTTQFTLVDFYRKLKDLPEMAGAELNIEGLAFSSDQLFLLNRSNNLIFSFPKAETLKHIMEDGPFIHPKIVAYKLPAINGIESGFSGATYHAEGACLLFTSSVEDTDNAYDDGAVLGSFIGKIPMDKKGLTSSFEYVQLPVQGEPLKIESITVEEVIAPNKLQILGCTDSDGGASEIFRALLTW